MIVPEPERNDVAWGGLDVVRGVQHGVVHTDIDNVDVDFAARDDGSIGGGHTENLVRQAPNIVKQWLCPGVPA